MLLQTNFFWKFRNLDPDIINEYDIIYNPDIIDEYIENWQIDENKKKYNSFL